LQILQKYCAIEKPLQEGVAHVEDTGCTSKHCIHIISFVVCRSME
jgi:hypothetical protein